MPRKDIYHNAVKQALIKDGWTITHDPFSVKIGKKILQVDLGGEKIIAAEKGSRKIAVEIKSFVGASEVNDLQKAVGQYVMYLRIFSKINIHRMLYIAVPESAFESVFQIELGQLFLEDNFLNLIVFDEIQEVITRWIPN